MTRAILVAGTFGFRGSIPAGAWWAADSPFAKMIASLGLDVAGSRSGERSFIWSSDLDGVFESEHVDWKAGGSSLYEYVVPSLCAGARIAPAETTIIAHSHGLQPALYAMAAGLQGRLVSVCSPCRADMQAVTKLARPNISRWTHLYDPDDPIQVAGQEPWACSRDAVLADANVQIPGMGHTGAVEDEKNFFRWLANPTWIK